MRKARISKCSGTAFWYSWLFYFPGSYVVKACLTVISSARYVQVVSLPRSYFLFFSVMLGSGLVSALLRKFVDWKLQRMTRTIKKHMKQPFTVCVSFILSLSLLAIFSATSLLKAFCFPPLKHVSMRFYCIHKIPTCMLRYLAEQQTVPNCWD